MGDRFKNRRHDKAKLEWTAAKPCHVRGYPGHVCNRTVVHHVGQERHDDQTVPLCRCAHDELHGHGKQTFAKKYHIRDYHAVARRYEAEYRMDNWNLREFT